MTNEEAVRILSERSEILKHDYVYQNNEREYTEALEIAIAVLERPAAPGKAIDHSGDSTDMVTQ